MQFCARARQVSDRAAVAFFTLLFRGSHSSTVVSYFASCERVLLWLRLLRFDLVSGEHPFSLNRFKIKCTAPQTEIRCSAIGFGSLVSITNIIVSCCETCRFKLVTCGMPHADLLLSQEIRACRVPYPLARLLFLTYGGTP